MHHTCYLFEGRQNATVQQENYPSYCKDRATTQQVTKKWYTRVTGRVLWFG